MGPSEVPKAIWDEGRCGAGLMNAEAGILTGLSSVAEGKAMLSQYFYLSLAFKLSHMEVTQEEKGQEDEWEREGEHGVGGKSLTIPPP